MRSASTTLNQLLSEMDGFTVDQGVVFVAATNRIDLLDPAILRAGRFDEKVRIARPSTEGRFDILKVFFIISQAEHFGALECLAERIRRCCTQCRLAFSEMACPLRRLPSSLLDASQGPFCVLFAAAPQQGGQDDWGST